MEVKPDLKEYWKTNITYVLSLLSIWFVVSYVCGILAVDKLDAMGSIGGFPLGFWFANQGAEITFVILIVVYVNLMNKLDKKYDVDEK